MKKFLIIKGAKVVGTVIGVPKEQRSDIIVERYQKASIHYQCHGTLPAIRWKVSEADNMIDALIESGTF